MTPITFAEILVIGLLALPWLRPIKDRELVRLGFGIWLVFAVGLVATSAALVVTAWLAPVALHGVLAATVVIALASWWRGRPSFGKARGLPPGSLAVTRSLAALTDRGFYATAFKQHGPIIKMAQFHRGVICVLGLERGHRLLREHRDQLGASPLPFSSGIPKGFLRYMKPHDHKEYGRLLRTAISPGVVAAAEDVTRAEARRLLKEMAEACSRTSGAGIDPTPWLERLSQVAFLKTLLGIRPGTEAAEVFERNYGALQRQPLSRRLDAPTQASLAELRALLHLQIEALEQDGVSNHTSSPESALEVLASVSGQPDRTSLENLLFIIRISTSNVSSLLRWIMKLLGDHPPWVTNLQEQAPSGDAGVPSLPDRIVMETLRLEQSEYLYRTIVEPFSFEGFELPRGWLLRVCVKESHRLAETFEDPTLFNPDRFLDRSYKRSEYAPFGYGGHACNGVQLSNMICRVWLEELTSFDWHTVGDGPLERDLRHWSHWRPSGRFSIVIGATERASK